MRTFFIIDRLRDYLILFLLMLTISINREFANLLSLNDLVVRSLKF